MENAAEFQVLARQNGTRDAASVALSGDLDLATAPKLRECLTRLIADGVVDLAFDLTDVGFINSTGISVFVMAQKQTEQAGGSVVLRNACPEVFRLFEITGLVEWLSVSGVEMATKTLSESDKSVAASKRLKSDGLSNVPTAPAQSGTI